jgi:tetratricopeptide (TPR) repeat protein
MSARTRVVIVVALAAALVAGGVVGATLLQSRGESTGTSARKGAPPLELPASRALTLYRAGKRKEAGTLFARSHTLAGEIGVAFSAWPHGTLDAMKRIVSTNPHSALAELHLGLAYYWSGQDEDAVTSWKAAAKVQPDTAYAVTALDFLHPDVALGLPPIIVDASQVDARARTLLLQGVQLWDDERPVSARRILAQAVARAPHDPVVLTAAAVATFSPATPLRPFPKLGPLTGAFPKAAVVRFHLGELLLWTRQVEKGEAQLRLAVSTQPGSAYAQAAKRILELLAKDGSK